MEVEQVLAALQELLRPKTDLEKFEEVPGRLFERIGKYRQEVAIGNGTVTGEAVAYATPERTAKAKGVQITCSTADSGPTQFFLDCDEVEPLRESFLKLQDLSKQNSHTAERRRWLAYKTRHGLTIETTVDPGAEGKDCLQVAVTLGDLITVQLTDGHEMASLCRLLPDAGAIDKMV
jgi:hypothetical protein